MRVCEAAQRGGVREPAEHVGQRGLIEANIIHLFKYSSHAPSLPSPSNKTSVRLFNTSSVVGLW